MPFLPVPFKDFFKPIFNVKEIKKISIDFQYGIDKMRGNIEEDDYPEGYRKKAFEIMGFSALKKTQKDATFFNTKNACNQSQRHFSRALSAMRDLIESHKGFSLFRLVWRYGNIFPLIRYAFGKKTEIQQLINHKAILKQLAPMIQEMTLGILFFLNKESAIGSGCIRKNESYFRNSIKKILNSLSFEEMKSLLENPLENNKIILGHLLPLISKSALSAAVIVDMSKIKMTDFLSDSSLSGLGEGLKATRQFLSDMTAIKALSQKRHSEVSPIVMSDPLKKTEWQAQICAKVATLHESAKKIVVPPCKKNPSAQNAFREILIDEYPMPLSSWGIFKAAIGFKAASLKMDLLCGPSAEDLDVVKAINNQVEQQASKGIYSNRLGNILDRAERVVESRKNFF